MLRNRNREREAGQSILEFALVFPLFVFFLFAIIDVGIAMQHRATLQHAAREGARYAATKSNLNDGVVMDRTIDQAQGLVEQDDVCISYIDVEGGPDVEEGDAVDVTVSYEYEPFILRSALGLFGTTIPNVDMTVTGSARLEVDVDDQAGLCP